MFDISLDIKKINQFKEQYKVLNEDGEMTHFNYEDLAILLLRKSNLDNTQSILLVYNKDWQANHDVNLPDLNEYLTFATKIIKINIDASPETITIKEYQFEKNLNPNEYVMFFQQK